MKKLFALTLAITTCLSQYALAEGSTVGLGVEGYYSKYNEPGLMEEEGENFSVTGYYSYEQSNSFVSLDGRVSYGGSDYDSPISGTQSGTPEWEFELRSRLGYSFPLWGGSLSPYTGIGGRYYMQEGKGRYTDTGAFSYDRRIAQVYIPVGVSYAYTTRGGWTLTPMIEADYLVYGDVNSRLANGSPLYYNINNTQKAGSGYGIRSEFMFGKSARNYAWQFGPFVRYWKVKDSEITTAPDSSQWLEPENDRTQIGMALRVLW